MVTHEKKMDRLRDLMARENIAALIVPSADPHQSEYVTDHWQARCWLTGFSGSAGTAVLTRDRALLWTDSRYWLQAAQQIRETGFELIKAGEPDTPDVHEWLSDTLSPGDVIAMDGQVVSRTQARKYRKNFDKKEMALRTDLDLVRDAWIDRPPRPATRAWDFSVQYAGKSRKDKIAAIRERVASAGADWHVMPGLEDIAWTFNLRGSDAPNNPVNIAFSLIGRERALLFMDPAKLDDPLIDTLRSDGIELLAYAAVYDELKKLADGDGILLDPAVVSETLFQAVNPGCRIVETIGPATRLKAVKNETEINHLRATALKDGVAKTRFLHWLENQGPDDSVTEQQVADILLGFRKQQDDFVENSFDPIMAFGDHSAMCHYSATAETDVPLTRGMFLTDSGGNYLTGTTDITRTVCLGSATPGQIRDYTLVLKGHIAVSTARFPKGTKGFQIDTLARQYLWQAGMNFGHGTGHGVGFFLCVHEGPARISPLPVDEPLEPGMLLTNEPGLYREGEYGIRLENMVLVAEEEKTEFGQFMAFENLTLCHFETDLMDTDLLTPLEIGWINDYHDRVYTTLAPLLDADVRAWLRTKTAPL